ncbi:MAG TPA: hypothetical protein VMQ44_00850 [Candidatus Saccharimonadales bacterium]|nr:hypothetical protein [Candidatus Saccharimonadales bacterium]
MKPIYLEPDEEITSVIDKIKAVSDRQLALVVAKNSPLAQSLVNLKLIAKEADSQDKDLCLITTNKVSAKLAGQVGLKTYASLGSVGSVARPAPSPKPEKTELPMTEEEKASEKLADGTVVNQYRPDVPVGDEEPELPIVEPVKDEPAVEEPAAEEIATEPAEGESDSSEALPTAETLDESEKEKKEEKVTPEPIKPPKIDEPAELPAVVSRTISVAPTEHREFHFPWKSALIALGILIIGAVAMAIFYPRATVTITLPATHKEATLPLNIKTTVDSDPATLAGSLLTTEKTANSAITATGKKDIGSKATGNITIYDKVGGSNVTLTAGTVLTTGGKNYILDKTVVVPIATVSGTGTIVPGQVAASITASTAGDTYNVSSATFSVGGQSSSIYGTGSTSGGSTKTVTVLAQSDIDTALTALRAQVTTDAQTELTSKAQGQTILGGSIYQISKKETVDHAVGDQVDTATATVDYQLGVLAFDKSQAISKLTDTLGQSLATNQEFQLKEDAPPTLTFKSYSTDNQTMAIEAAGSGYIIAKVDKTAVAKLIHNTSKPAATQKITDTYQAEKVDISVNPSWWFNRLPILSGAIKIDFGYDAQQPPAAQ